MRLTGAAVVVLLLLGGATPARGQTPRAEARQLANLARALKDQPGASSYARLAKFAEQHAKDTFGAQAALALGYYDSANGSSANAKQWFGKAQGDPLLREYVLFGEAQADRALSQNADALAALEALRKEYPASALTDDAVEALAQTALALARPERAAAELDAYGGTENRPALLLLRAQAREQAARQKPDRVAAAQDYQELYYRFPLSDEANIAGAKLYDFLQELGESYPGVPLSRQLSRAQSLFEARRWEDVRGDYERLLPQLSGTDRELAELRIGQARVEQGASPDLLASLRLKDPELDAERLYVLSQELRSVKLEQPMLAAIEQIVQQYPNSRWAEEGLYSAGNYYWVLLDRKRASAFYSRVVAQYPKGKRSLVAHWRVAWTAYLERRPDAVSLLEEHLMRFPGSAYSENALYWLGRAAERAGKRAQARGFYLKLRDRFPQSYYGLRAAARLRVLGTRPARRMDSLGAIPDPPRVSQLDGPIPAEVAVRWDRAVALRRIALDAFAEQELRAAFAANRSRRLLMEIARAALDAGHYSAAILAARQAVPQVEAHRINEVPWAVWRLVYPLPYESSVKREARRRGLDPMFVAGIIRQESIFQADAVSRAGAIGLMQVLPSTGRTLAGRLRLGYSESRLTDPEYNLRLGTLYLADLLKQFGSREAALAAFNAGEDRVRTWEADRNYAEPAEFVESIPFTETREYVQIVMRNAEMYRILYSRPARSAR